MQSKKQRVKKTSLLQSKKQLVFELQVALLYTGQQEQEVHQISFHPTDPNLLCSLGADGVSLWSIDKFRSQDQDQMRHVPVQMPGKSPQCSNSRGESRYKQQLA